MRATRRRTPRRVWNVAWPWWALSARRRLPSAVAAFSYVFASGATGPHIQHHHLRPSRTPCANPGRDLKLGDLRRRDPDEPDAVFSTTKVQRVANREFRVARAPHAAGYRVTGPLVKHTRPLFPCDGSVAMALFQAIRQRADSEGAVATRRECLPSACTERTLETQQTMRRTFVGRT